MPTLEKEWTERLERVPAEPRVFLDVSNIDGLKSHLHHANIAQTNFDEGKRFQPTILGEILQDKLRLLWRLFLRCLPDDAPEKIKLAEMKAEHERLAEQLKLADEAKKAAAAALANFERGFANAEKYGIGL